LRKKLIIFIVIGIIIIIGIYLIFNGIRNRSEQPPKIVISKMEWDYGVVKPNDKPTHIFTIKNEGDEELIIERVRVSCGCVKVAISNKNIKPGKSAELKAIFDTTGYEGKLNKDIYIRSNDPQEPEKVIALFIEIEHKSKPIISILESEWNLDLISQGDTNSFKFFIKNSGDENLIIDRVNFYKHIKHNLVVPLIINPKEKYEVILTYDSTDHELGEVREAVWIYSNDTRREGVSIKIKGYIKEMLTPAVNISPVELIFNLVNSSKEEITEKFSLQNLGEKAIKIISVNSSADYLVPLSSEFDLNSGEQKELQVILLKDKAREEIEEEETEEYIYLTIALPIKITK
jgi:hypothetical protein